MRIRQVKPSFFTDGTMARISYPARLFYIGLWCVADDAGWMRWDPIEIGALLYPFESPSRRLSNIKRWTEELVGPERVVIHECGCAHVVHLEEHQRTKGGSQSFAARDEHRKHTIRTYPDSSGDVRINARGTVRNGKERNGKDDADKSGEEATSEFQRLVPRPMSAGSVH